MASKQHKAQQARTRAEKQRQRGFSRKAAAEASAEFRRYHSVGNRKAKPKRQQVFADEPEHMLTRSTTVHGVNNFPRGLKRGLNRCRLPDWLEPAVLEILKSEKSNKNKRLAILELMADYGYALPDLKGNRRKIPVTVQTVGEDGEPEYTEVYVKPGQHLRVERDTGQHRLHDDFLPGSREKRFIPAPKN